jgi:hypothetical protein
MPFTVKDWKDSPDSSTPISAVALEDMETRLSAYTDLVNGKKTIIATTQSLTSTSYGTMTTPDQVTGIVLPADALIAVAYQATWQESVANAGRAAIFVGANQLKVSDGSGTAPSAITAEAVMSAAANTDRPLATSGVGLQSGNFASAYTGDVTTGQVVAATSSFWGPCVIFAAAGTYTISIQFKSTSGSVTVKNRKLWVEVKAFN